MAFTSVYYDKTFPKQKISDSKSSEQFDILAGEYKAFRNLLRSIDENVTIQEQFMIFQE